jgi:hypothetical protein
MDPMNRTCDGTDLNLPDGPTPNAGPCACGLTFDDTTRSTVYPHVFLMTPQDRARMTTWLDTVSVEEITAMDPAVLRQRFAATILEA